MAMERAVKYSEKEGKGKVSFQSLKKALVEMKIDIRIKEKEMEEIQKPERILSQTQSIGAPSEKRVKEHIVSLQKKVRTGRDWVIQKRKGIEKAKSLIFRMEKQLFT